MNPRGFTDRAGPLAARLIPRTPSVTRCARCLAALAADASEHGGHIICDDGDFRSKTAERQYANFALIKEIFPLDTAYENILVDFEGFLLHLYFCVRLRFSICH
ncbi:hypothetical protein [Paraburkholderia fungorum]|jgi:hypothetical protein|uniref:Uncharacterized protein n=1 Tax=Paraburkholderia fungorum TaxID=134537 RepID=A0AAW3UVD7_9BURK|nr:hypothetical protein [Paraburkholderia fungorum]MBB4513006.1 hypothetical protein [Paraburkholderia fungorum]MBB5540742.1 hypothetical protein [Paraburkholderia fungorum]MBB6201567.1 hypothetical protein [Paraburkholderia fungorum]USU18679.1 hypothetical protein NFE55_31455 [Paraburkholderia fungorum]USU29326.1 hypothetical protein NFS19_30115 [Paraburkholderia fungorum]